VITFKSFSVLATVIFLAKAVLDWTGFSEADLVRHDIEALRNEMRGPE
jgi:hypothetical protein